MPTDAEQGLLERATIALERQEHAFERQAQAFERQEQALNSMLERWERNETRAEERHRRLIEQSKASERVFIAAFTEIDESLRQNTTRLDDMGEAIRANTRTVLAALDRIGPAPA